MLVLGVLGACLLTLVGVFWLEARIDRMEREARSRRRHPAGSFCAVCGYEVEDWATHERLAHGQRLRAPDDMV
jgi:hypothetical protein